MNNKKYRCFLVVLLEAILLFFLCIQIGKGGKSYDLGAGENITLPYGHYYITCNYEVEKNIGTVNFMYIEDSTGSTKHIKQTDNYLSDENTEYTTEFWITSLKEDIHISVREFGEKAESPSAAIEKYIIQATGYTSFLGFLFVMALMLLTVTGFLISADKILISKDRIRVICTITGAVIISSIPLIGNGLICGEDTMIQLIRLEGIKDGYLSGQFPVRVEPTFLAGYGYAFSTYYGSLLYNIPAFFRLMGFSIQDAYKVYVVFINVITAFISYYSFKKIFKKSEHALTGCLLYTLSLYRFYVLYRRGAVGEFTALAFLPLIAAGLWCIYTTPTENKEYRKLWIMPVLGFFGVIESHVLSTEIYGMYTILVCLLMFKKTFRKETFIVLIKILIISIILNAAYLLPFIENYLFEDVVVNSDLLIETNMKSDISVVNLFQFFTGTLKEDIYWKYYIKGGFGPSFLTVIVLLIYVLKNGVSKQTKKCITIMAVIVLLSSILCSTLMPWEKILTSLYTGIANNNIINMLTKKISLLFINVQFPARFLTVGIAAFTIMTCSILSQKDNNGILRFGKIIIISLTVVQFIWLSAFVILRSDKINLYTISPMDKSVTCNIGNFEYIPLLNDGNMPYTNMFTEVEECLTSNAEVTEFSKQYTNIVCHVKASDDLPGVVELPLLYYRGYKAYDVDTGKEFKLMKSGSSARLSFYVESGYEGNVKVCYKGKTSWHVAEIVSLITFICIIILALNKVSNGHNIRHEKTVDNISDL